MFYLLLDYEFVYKMYVHCIQAKSRWFNGTIVSAPSYLGQKFAAQGPGEGLAVLGLIYGGALIGKVDFGGIDARFVSIYADPKGASLKILRAVAHSPIFVLVCTYCVVLFLGARSRMVLVFVFFFFQMARCEEC